MRGDVGLTHKAVVLVDRYQGALLVNTVKLGATLLIDRKQFLERHEVDGFCCMLPAVTGFISAIP
jgi:hypothetical protein